MHCRVEDKLFLCIKTKNSSWYSKIRMKTLHLRLNTDDLTLNFWIITLSYKIPSQNSWKTAQWLKMLYNDAPVTGQRFGHNVLPPEFPCAVFFFNLLKTSFVFREYLIFLSNIINHRVFDKFIQWKCWIKSASHYFYCFNSITNSWRVRSRHCIKWARDTISCCFSSPSTNHVVGCYILTLNFTIHEWYVISTQVHP